MKPQTLVAIAAIALLTAGVLAAAATTNLLSVNHPDPYERTSNYSVTGTSDSNLVVGNAVCSTVHENGAFHNYRFEAELSRDGSAPIKDTFLLIFEPGDVPSFLSDTGTVDKDGVLAKRYEGTIDSRFVAIVVGDYCEILEYHTTVGGLSYSGIISK